MGEKYLELEEGEELKVSDDWKIIKKEGNIAIVTDGQRKGRTPLRRHGDAFLCPTCGKYGPWNGVVCLSCGYRSEPD